MSACAYESWRSCGVSWKRTSRHAQGLKKGHWSQVRFRGDDMLRPLTSHEIAWLAVLLVRLSEALNRRLGLDAASDNQHSQPETIFQVGTVIG